MQLAYPTSIGMLRGAFQDYRTRCEARDRCRRSDFLVSTKAAVPGAEPVSVARSVVLLFVIISFSYGSFSYVVCNCTFTLLYVLRPAVCLQFCFDAVVR